MTVRFIRLWLLIVTLLTGGMMALNAYVDPLWLFDHSNIWNVRQWGFDERQQKINRIEFGGPLMADALLLGSSRSTYISAADFQNNQVFNLAASGMRPSEFGDYIAFAEGKHGRPFEVIYLGLDFFATNMLNMSQAEPAIAYIRRAQSPLYRLESLLSYDSFNNTRRYIRDSLAVEGCDCYDRTLRKQRPIRASADREAALADDLGMYRSTVYGKYQYDPYYLSTLRNLKERFPRTRFILFTTPESAVLFDLLVTLGLRDDYERWLAEIIAIFGELYDFMGHNSITNNPENYADGHHFYPPVGALIAARLEGRPIPVSDFGVLRK